MGDIPSGPSSLQEILEAEFCPPLDTTLVAAFLADHIPPNESPTESVLKKLREELSTLAASAAADQDLAGDFDDDLQLSTNASSATTTTASTTEDNYDADSVFSQSGPEASLSSRSSNSPPSDVTYPTDSYPALAFLRAAFPHLSVRELAARINEADVDMEAVVEDLLSQDCVRELEERGLEGEEQEEESENWTLITRKTKPPSRSQTSPRKRRKPKGKTLAINDIRQKQHMRPNSQIRTSGDPWVQVSSISSRLEELLPSSSSVFQSYLHNPEYGTPSTAVRAALDSVALERKEKSSPGNRQDTTSSLFTLIEFIRVSPEYDFDNANSEARAQICADVELALAAAEGSPDVALDIVKLLYDLDVDNESNQEMGVYHSPVPPRSGSQLSIAIKSAPGTSSTPSSPLSPTRRSTIPIVPPSTVPEERPPPAPSQSSWQLVKPARPKPPDVHPLAAHIPAYNPNNVPRRKGRPIHHSLANPATSRRDNARSAIATRIGQPSLSKAVLGSAYKARIDACQARRYEALRAAGRYWASGGVRGRGGEVALFYAQEAQRHQVEAQRLQLDAMRELVDEKRFALTNTDVIDVHYCTTVEALVIVREVLDEGWVSSVRPLRVITGRGTHSTGGVPVLGPAVKKALEQDGWSVGKLDIGLTVRGRVR